jgi:hypothetical protein
VATTVVVAGVSAAFVGALQRSAIGDPSRAQISFSLTDLTMTHDWSRRLPAGDFTIETALRGPLGSYAVVVGDCPGVVRMAEVVFPEPGGCADVPQRGTGGIGGASATWVVVAGRRIDLPPASSDAVISNVTWDLKFPVADASWISRLHTGQVTYWVSRTDGSYNRVLSDLDSAFPTLRVRAGYVNPERFAEVQRHVQTVRAGSFLGLLLCVGALLLAAIESRWERVRSLTALAAIGMTAKRMRRASAVEFAVPVLFGAVPAACVAVIGGWAVASFYGSDGILVPGVVVWTLGSAVFCVVASALVGWSIGAVSFQRENLAVR